MDFVSQTVHLKHNAETIRSLVEGISDDQARWKPAPDSWSVLEVVNHLYDEEREDFRPRLDLILHNPDQPLQKIDPVGWVDERQYNQRGLDASLLKFMDERRESLRWLGTLQSPNWDSVYQMPWGPMTAGDMFASWITHDMLHMRQIVRLQWLFARQELDPYEIKYAGSW